MIGGVSLSYGNNSQCNVLKSHWQIFAQTLDSLKETIDLKPIKSISDNIKITENDQKVTTRRYVALNCN